MYRTMLDSAVEYLCVSYLYVSHTHTLQPCWQQSSGPGSWGHLGALVQHAEDAKMHAYVSATSTCTFQGC